MSVNLATFTKVTRSWDLKEYLLQRIAARGGWVNAHAHLDRAFVISPQKLKLANKHLHDKWHLIKEFKLHSPTAIYDRMAFGVERLLDQGVTALATCIDVDPLTRDHAIKAAQKVRDRYGKKITLKFINHTTITGVLTREGRKWFDLGSQFADIVGGLTGKDKGHEAQALDVVLGTAKNMHKRAHIHVDQLNSKKEKETELLVKKTLEYGLQGQVSAIHSISVAAHPKSYRLKLYKKMKTAGVSVIACPTAWIDARRSEEKTPTHNAITPVDELIPAGVTVALGTDNIADLYKPFSDGDMWTELRFLLEACHFYDLEKLVQIATLNGKKVLGIT